MPLQWPDYLHEADGEMRFIGNRLTFHDVLRLYVDLGHSAEMIAVEHPSLELSTLYKFIAFYLENTAEIDLLLAAEKTHNDQVRSAAPNHLTLAELRRRSAARSLPA